MICVDKMRVCSRQAMRQIESVADQYDSVHLLAIE